MQINDLYYNKYLKYKNKYFNLKNYFGGGPDPVPVPDIETTFDRDGFELITVEE